MTDFPRKLADRFPTPFYAYDLDKTEDQVGTLLKLFPRQVKPRLYYALKANPHPGIADSIRKAGAQAGLGSTGEIEAALTAGFDFSKALYGGPGKDQQEISVAIMSGVRRFSIESWHDYVSVGKAAAAANVLVQGLLRVNPGDSASQFGFEESDLLENGTRRLGQFAEHVAVEGVHFHGGTQLDGVEELAAGFELAVEMAERISDAASFPLKVLNFGGGFPWPYAQAGEGTDLTKLGARLHEIFENASAAKKAEWWFESGRFCSASSGTLVARVMEIKDSKDRRFVVLDTGIHHFSGMTDSRSEKLLTLQGPAERTGKLREVEIVGQLDTPRDVLGRDQLLPDDLRIGDIVTIPNVGAYGLTRSVTGFMSRPTPLEICYRDGDVTNIYQLRTGHAELPVINFKATRSGLLTQKTIA